jgi:hypothetical protein
MFEGIVGAGVDFEFEAIGFELPEIDFRIQSLEPPEAADQADELTAAEGRQFHDQAICGCWESTGFIAAALSTLRTKTSCSTAKKRRLCSPIPRYNVKINGNVCGSGAIKHREFAMAAAGEMSPEEFTAVLVKSLNLARRHTAPER